MRVHSRIGRSRQALRSDETLHLTRREGLDGRGERQLNGERGGWLDGEAAPQGWRRRFGVFGENCTHSRRVRPGGAFTDSGLGDAGDETLRRGARRQTNCNRRDSRTRTASAHLVGGRESIVGMRWCCGPAGPATPLLEAPPQALNDAFGPMSIRPHNTVRPLVLLLPDGPPELRSALF